jgi:hypothetical protein
MTGDRAGDYGQRVLTVDEHSVLPHAVRPWPVCRIGDVQVILDDVSY